MRKLRWGIIGCGRMGRRLALALRTARTGALVAAGSRTREGAERFAGEFGVRPHASYDDLLANPEVDAVYIAIPHPEHARWAIKAAEAHKHILCEKPLTMNAAETEKVLAAAQANRVFLLEAYMYRTHPLTARWVELLRAQAIGELRVIQSSLSFLTDGDPRGRLLNPALGGGGILDAGGYPVSLARLAVGAALGQNFIEPLEVLGAGHIGETGVDEYASAILKFPEDIVAEVSCGVRLARDNKTRFYGTEGELEIADPFFCQSDIILWKLGAKAPEIIKNPAPRADLYTFEVDLVAECLEQHKAPAPPAMTWDDSLGQARVLDGWLKAVKPAVR